MKTKTLLLLCLFMGIGLTQLSGQNGKNGNGAVTGFDVYITTADYPMQPVYCGDVMVDELYGTTTYHFVAHFKNGILISENVHYEGVVQSKNTTEEFKYSDNDKIDYNSGIVISHFNLIGDQGTHYIGTLIWGGVNDPDYTNPVPGKAMCLENGKY